MPIAAQSCAGGIGFDIERLGEGFGRQICLHHGCSKKRNAHLSYAGIFIGENMAKVRRINGEKKAGLDISGPFSRREIGD